MKSAGNRTVAQADKPARPASSVSSARLLPSKADMLRAEKLASSGSWRRDLVSNSLVWSEGFYRILVLEPGSIAPSYEYYLRCIHPEDREREENARSLLMQVGFYEVRVRILARDGIIRHVLNRGELLKDGARAQIAGVTLDLTEHFLAQEALRESQERFRAYTESASDWVW